LLPLDSVRAGVLRHGGLRHGPAPGGDGLPGRPAPLCCNGCAAAARSPARPAAFAGVARLAHRPTFGNRGDGIGTLLPRARRAALLGAG